MTNDPVETFKENILNNELTNVTVEIAEVGIDSFLKDGPLKDLPGLNILYGLVKFTNSVREKFAIKKLAAFLNNLNDISQSDRDQFAAKISHSSDDQYEFFERLFLVIDRLESVEKAKICSNIFKLYIFGLMSKSLFMRFMSILEGVYLADLHSLFNDVHLGREGYFQLPKIEYTKREKSVEQSLISYGLKETELTFTLKSRLSEKPEIGQKTKVTTLGQQLAFAMYYNNDWLEMFKQSELDRYHYASDPY